MKKLLSALLIATLLIASVACVFAAAEEGDTVVFNFLDAIEEADTEDATIAFVDGAVVITLKRAVTAEAPLFLVDAYDNVVIDLAEQTYLAVDFITTGTEADFRAHYTRNNNGEVQTADNYFSGAKANTDNVKSSGDTYVVWDITAYTASRRLETGHAFLDFAIMNAAEGDVITINTYALVNDADAMVVGTPLAPKATAGGDDGNTDDGDDNGNTDDGDDNGNTDNGDDNGNADDGNGGKEDDAPGTGDAGLIAFAALAGVALAGGYVVVRKRG